MYLLAHCYRIGIETDIDKEKAIELYQVAANLGNSLAQYNLAHMYKDGEGRVVVELPNKKHDRTSEN